MLDILLKQRRNGNKQLLEFVEFSCSLTLDNYSKMANLSGYAFPQTRQPGLICRVLVRALARLCSSLANLHEGFKTIIGFYQLL